MTRKDTIKRQLQHTMNAATCLHIVLIEIRRSDLRPEAKSGKQIPAEKQSVLGGVVTAVSMRMPRQRHHPKSSPDGKLIAIIEQTIQPERRLTQQPTPHPFSHTSDTPEPGVTRTPLIMLQIALRSCNPRRMLRGQCRRIPHMIQMTMREQDATNRQPLPATRHQSRMQCPLPANEAGVDEIKSLAIPQDEKLHDERADNEQIRRHADPHTLESLFS